MADAAQTRREFRLPDLGEGLEDAELTAWHVDAGDVVGLNQPLCTVETAKAEVEVPSPFAGTVAARHGEVGDVVAVGAVLVEIDVADGVGTPRSPVLVGYGAAATASTPRRRRRSTVTGASPPAGPGPGAGGAGGGAPTWGMPVAAPAPLATPPVRLLARRLGIDLATVTPTGPHGTISRADVEAAAAGGSAAGPTDRPAVDDGGATALRGLRRVAAERVARSRREIPEAGATIQVDATALVEARDALQDAAHAAGRATVVTPFSLLCRLVVDALRAVPALHASMDDAGEVVRRHDAVHLGVAVATRRGLVVPVVRDAHRRGVHDLAVEMRRLADAARDGTLAPADLQGSTFSVTNFGALGLDDGYPVINHPDGAILGVGSIAPRPWVVDGALAVRRTATLTLVFDHRLADGADAGAFLGSLRRAIEAPARLLLDV